MSLRVRFFIIAVAAMLSLGLGNDVFARAGGGSSFGSRGGSTFSAPSGAAPIQRSMTPNSPSSNQGIFRPNSSPAGGMFSGGFGRGLMGGLMGGLLGAGLFGLLSGNGLFGGLGGGFSIFGLLIQLGLLYLLYKVVMGFIRNRQPATQGASFDRLSPQTGAAPSTFGFGGGGGGKKPLTLSPADFDSFEQRLSFIQSAYGGEDLDHLRSFVTPEMASYFAEEIAGNAARGLVNKISNVKLVKGDLAEAWSEPQADFATVSMSFSLIDIMVERASGKIVSGDPINPQQVTEFWTFQRRPGGGPNDWKLSAIQQTA
jgi:predicted lipid-binding transport protein (Tim44 family)